MSEGPLPAAHPQPGDYVLWKDWRAEAFGQPAAHEARVFAMEIGRAGRDFPAGCSVLEIGFGNGAFMAYARGRGWSITGTEANTELVDRARNAGFDAHHAQDVHALSDARFDLIVAFDVLEHIPAASLGAFLSEVRSLLQPGGRFIARFPNGDSPFGLANQHGDPTHVTVLGCGKAAALAQQAGLRVIYLGGAAETHGAETLLSKAHHRLAMGLRKAADWCVGEVFYDRAKIAFSSRNLTLVCASA